MKKKINSVTPVHRSRQFDTQGALSILRQFYREASKELKKNEKTIVNLNGEDGMCNITFVADGFNLSLIITEGGEI